MSKRHLLPSFWNSPSLTRRESGDPFSALQQEIDTLFDEFTRGSRFLPWIGRANGWAPRVDMTETGHDLQISAELPGVDEKDVEVLVSDDVLTVILPKPAEERKATKKITVKAA